VRPLFSEKKKETCMPVVSRLHVPQIPERRNVFFADQSGERERALDRSSRTWPDQGKTLIVGKDYAGD